MTSVRAAKFDRIPSDYKNEPPIAGFQPSVFVCHVPRSREFAEFSEFSENPRRSLYFRRKSAVSRASEDSRGREEKTREGTSRWRTPRNYSFDRTIAIQRQQRARSRQGLIINSNLGVRAICDSAPLSTGSNEGRAAYFLLTWHVHEWSPL